MQSSSRIRPISVLARGAQRCCRGPRRVCMRSDRPQCAAPAPPCSVATAFQPCLSSRQRSGRHADERLLAPRISWEVLLLLSHAQTPSPSVDAASQAQPRLQSVTQAHRRGTLATLQAGLGTVLATTGLSLAVTWALAAAASAAADPTTAVSSSAAVLEQATSLPLAAQSANEAALSTAVTAVTDAAAVLTGAAAPPPSLPASEQYVLEGVTAVLQGGAVALLAAALLKGLNTMPDAPPEEELPEPTLADFPALALHAGVLALRRPASLLLPATSALFCARCAAQVATAALRLQESKQLNAWAESAAAAVAQVDDLATKSASLAATIFVFWWLGSWKDEALTLLLLLPDVDDDVERIVLPLSTLVTTGLAAIGILTALRMVGFNLEPVMAVGGVSTILIGFGSQILTANAVSGVDLYVSQNFIKGDRVSLLTTDGAVVVTGVVESISLLYTTIRSDTSMPISIPNKAVAEMLVRNESRLKVSSSMAVFSHPRQLLLTLRIAREDQGRIDAVVKGLVTMLNNHPGVDQKLPRGAALDGYSDIGIEIGMLAHCKRELTPSFGAWKQNLLLEAEAVIRSCGAHIPVSRLYTGDAGGSQKAPDGSMANASNQ